MTQRHTITEVAPQIASGNLSPLELVERCLARIDRHEKQIRAWVFVDAEGAREAARRLAQEIADGRRRGPLHGIPIGIKDIVDVQGMPTRAGSSLTSDEPVTADAPVVTGLRKAGAIILGKTVTTEFACFDPSPTRNPWNLDHTPGGSSSGSAAAVATGMCLAAVGSQTGGSITRPASYCGVAGLKATFGRVSPERVVPVSCDHLDHVGPIGRSVADLAMMLGAMAPRIEIEDLSADVSNPPRLGIIESYFLQRASRSVAGATRRAIEVLETAGAATSVAELPDSFAQVHAMHRIIMAVDAANLHRELFAAQGNQFGPNLAALLQEGLAVRPEAYRAALDHQQRFREEILALFQGVDVLLTPATTTTAPGLETTGDPSFNSPWSYSGLPTISLLCELDEAGLPIAIQLIGRPNEESALLRTAAWCERRLGFDKAPPVIEP